MDEFETVIEMLNDLSDQHLQDVILQAEFILEDRSQDNMKV